MAAHEVTTCFPLATDRGMPCVHIVSLMRYVLIAMLWSIVMFVARESGVKRHVEVALKPEMFPMDAEDIPVWTIRSTLAIAWCLLPALIVHVPRFGLGAGPCLRSPNYCFATLTAPFLVWAGCTCCGTYNDAVAIFHGINMPSPL